MEATGRPIRVLFVCLGNICRSPLAEGVFGHLIEAEGLGGDFELDSAGTSAYHVGEPPDRRAREVARTRGVEYGGRSRQIATEDVGRFDYLIAMDADNLEEVERLADAARADAETRLLREFGPERDSPRAELDVPDPYYGGPDGFERVHDIIERSCRGLLEHIRRERAL